MKTKSLKVIFFAFLGMLVVSCGSDNETVTPVAPYCQPGQICTSSMYPNGNNGVGSTGSITLDKLVKEIPCQSSAGPNSYTIYGYRQNGGGTNQFNPNMGGYVDIQNVYAGRTSYGDVVIIKEVAGESELIIKQCSRAYIGGMQLTAMDASNILVNVSRQCQVNEITAGVLALNYGGNVLTLLPSPFHLHTPRPSICN